MSSEHRKKKKIDIPKETISIRLSTLNPGGVKVKRKSNKIKGKTAGISKGSSSTAEKNGKKERSIDEKIEDVMSGYYELLKHPRNELVIEDLGRLAASLATLFWQKGDYDKARSYFTAALDYYSQINDEFHVASVNGALGSLYIEMGDYSAALHYTLNAYKFWRVKNFLNERLICLQNLGIIYKNKNQIEEAVDYILDAMRLAIKLKDEDEFARSIQILLEYYEEQEDYQMLKELKLKALEFWEAMDLKERQFKTLIDLGVIYQVIEDFDKALSAFKKAFNIAYDLGDLERMYLAQGFIAEVYFNKRKIDEARKIYLEVYKLALFIGGLRRNKDGSFKPKDKERIEQTKLVLLSLGLTNSELRKHEQKALDEARKRLNSK